MGSYALLLYVTKQQEESIKKLFEEKNWLFCKSDTSQLRSPKKTVVVYEDLENCHPKIYTVSDTQCNNLYTELDGSLSGLTAFDVGHSKQPSNSALNVGLSGNSLDIKNCTVRLTRLSNKTKTTSKTSQIKTKGRVRNIRLGKIDKQENLVKSKGALAKTNASQGRPLKKRAGKTKTSAKAVKRESEENKDQDVEAKVEVKQNDAEEKVIKGFVNPSETFERLPDTDHWSEIVADDSNVSNDDKDYKPSDDEGDDDSNADAKEEFDGNIKEEKADPDYHIGYRINIRSKQKKRRVKNEFPCEKCKKVYKFETFYLNHLKEGVCKGPAKKKRQRDEDTGTGSYLCDVCKKTYAYKRKFKSHFINGRCRFQCQHCDKVCSRNMLKRHIFYKHELEDERFRCNICQRRFFEKNELVKHMPVHDSSRNFVCDFCGQAFFTYGNLYAHRKLKHLEKVTDTKHLCKLCNKEFKGKGNLIFHLKVTHMTIRNCMCELCGKKFKTERCVKMHMRSHAEARPFHCDVCGKDYKYSHQLSSHKKMFHSMLKRFYCKICSKGFYFEGKLKDHMNIHTGSKPHKCPHCDYSACTGNQLTQHKRKHRKPKVEPEKVDSDAAIAADTLVKVMAKDEQEGSEHVIVQKMETVEDTNLLVYTNKIDL